MVKAAKVREEKALATVSCEYIGRLRYEVQNVTKRSGPHSETQRNLSGLGLKPRKGYDVWITVHMQNVAGRGSCQQNNRQS